MENIHSSATKLSVTTLTIKCRYVECRTFIVILSVIRMNVVVLSVGTYSRLSSNICGDHEVASNSNSRVLLDSTAYIQRLGIRDNDIHHNVIQHNNRNGTLSITCNSNA